MGVAIKSSVVSYPDRGRWGDWRFHGNTTGHLIKDLIEHYGARTVLDPFAGSGTTRDVCTDLGVQCDSFDLKSGFDVLTSILPAKKYDLVFLHPPYHSIVKYSGDSRDLSNCADVPEYMSKLRTVITRLSEYLEDDGHMALFLGNVRRNGNYYPLPAFVETLFQPNLREEIVKIQHNVSSASKEYSGKNFIPIMHEKLLIFADFEPVTWAELIDRSIEMLGGRATNQELYDALRQHPKTIENRTYQATIRRTLQENARQVDLGIWTNENKE